MNATTSTKHETNEQTILWDAEDVILPERDPDAKDRSLRTYHKMMLGVSTVVILASFLLRVRDDQRVEIRFANGFVLPESCQSKILLNLKCPGCGLTRSFVSLAQGDWTASYRFHRLGWLVALLVVSQIPYRLWAIRYPQSALTHKRIAVTGFVVILVALWLSWGAEFLVQRVFSTRSF